VMVLFIIINVYNQKLKPAQAGFVWVATGFNPLLYLMIGAL